MGQKQKKQIARLRMMEQHASRQMCSLRMRLDNATRRAERAESVPQMQFAIPTQIAGSPALAYTFYVGLFEIQRMSTWDRELHFRNHTDKCLRELNENYPAPNEWHFKKAN